MFAIKQGSKRLVLLLSEIYGINDHIMSYAASYSEIGFDVAVPNFLQLKKPFDYPNEDLAYKVFTETIGFDTASEIIKCKISKLSEEYEEVHLVGFSIGATIAWICSETEGVSSVTGYYGSRIRDYLDIHPRVPALLIYGEVERSFDVEQMISKIESTNVIGVSFPAHHGFADCYSSTFHQTSCEEAWKIAIEFLGTFRQA